MIPDRHQKFWSLVDTSAGPDGCWPWTGRQTSNGYGAFDHDNRWSRAHRYAFALCYGFLPPVVRHACDTPLCTHPLDLLAGTQADNVRDRDERHRRNVKGERHPRALFDNEQVGLIRELTAAGWSQTALAREVDSNVSTINKIVKGHSYHDSF